MPLDPDEIARRLRAARALRDVKVQTLARHELLEANGLGGTMVGRIERLERVARPMELRVIADALDVPYWWFTEPDPFAGRDGAANGSGGSGAADLALLLRGVSVRLDRLLRTLDRQDDERFDATHDGWVDDRHEAATHSPPADDEDERAEQARARARQWRERDERDEREARSPHGSDVDEAASSD